MPKHTLTGEDRLVSTFFSIDPNRDTLITTPQGAVLTIPAGALEVSAGDTGPVKLEVKEAYRMADIIRGGLVTASGKLLLSNHQIGFDFRMTEFGWHNIDCLIRDADNVERQP